MEAIKIRSHINPDGSLHLQLPDNAQGAECEVIVLYEPRRDAPHAYTNHVTHAQIFQRDTVIGLHQLGAKFVQIVSALVGNMFLLALNSPQCFASVLAPTLCPRQFALQNAKLGLSRTIVVRVGDSLTVRRGQQGRNAHINTHGSLGFRQGCRF